MPTPGAEPASGSSSRGNEFTAALSRNRPSVGTTVAEATERGRSDAARTERPVGAVNGLARTATTRSRVETQPIALPPLQPAVQSMHARRPLSWKSLLPGSIQ